MAEVVVLRNEIEFQKHEWTHPYFCVSRPKLIHPGGVPEHVKNWVVCPRDNLVWWLFRYETDQMDFFRTYSGYIIWRGLNREY